MKYLAGELKVGDKIECRLTLDEDELDMRMGEVGEVVSTFNQINEFGKETAIVGIKFPRSTYYGLCSDGLFKKI